ncbi:MULTISPECIES: hypothetical protein [Oceanobacillus]|uniref:Uncharacterized protein n=1 Tax=Oceanobacillus kimchii TaxID=746691 RepID=A0ABQ5TQ94_9BACI|nr:hypothetical protein [Oceanobacillus kimchii]GLO68377.1 hypothetical protein MACH08_41610 [Oceanobacillus kimchii]
MSMYRIVNKETELIYSSSLGWVEENGKMYGHCFEREEAEEILDKLISDGIPVAMEKDKVASRFESAANFSIKNLFIGTVITFISLFITLFILRDIPLNYNREEVVTFIYSIYEPLFTYLSNLG